MNAVQDGSVARSLLFCGFLIRISNRNNRLVFCVNTDLCHSADLRGEMGQR